MTPWPLSVAFPLTLLGGIALILVFDSGAAWFTRAVPTRYRRMWTVQFAIYVLIGYVAMLALLDIRRVELVGVIVAFVEATAGWAITTRIGPGRVAKANPVSIAIVVASMTAFGLALSVAGALLFNLTVRIMVSTHR